MHSRSITFSIFLCKCAYIHKTISSTTTKISPIHRSFASNPVLSSLPIPFPLSLLCPSASPRPAYPFPSPPCFPPFPLTYSNHTAIPNNAPCNVPVTKYSPQALHPSLPSLPARLPAHTKLPGVWMHIVGMDKLPTALRRQVVHIWGRNWMLARMVARMPRTLA